MVNTCSQCLMVKRWIKCWFVDKINVFKQVSKRLVAKITVQSKIVEIAKFYCYAKNKFKYKQKHKIF